MSARALLDLLESRRSVRRFRDEPIEERTQRALVEAASWAPSAGNVQPWAFVRVQATELRERMAQAACAQRFVATAPLIVVVCADLERARQAYGERGASLYCLQDTAAATQNLLLAAHALGLGACWIGAFRQSELAELLRLPVALRPVTMVAVGWPAEQPTGPGRRPLSEISFVAEPEADLPR